MSEVELQTENSSSEKHNGVSVDDVLSAIQQKNIGQAKAHFSDLMGIKINNALESEKVKISNQVFNAQPEAAAEAPELEELDTDLESEVEDAFGEEETNLE